MSSLFVIPGLVPGIQPTTVAGAGGALDPGDKHRDDNSRRLACTTTSPSSMPFSQFKRAVADFSLADRHKLFADNAARFYRIEVQRPA